MWKQGQCGPLEIRRVSVRTPGRGISVMAMLFDLIFMALTALVVLFGLGYAMWRVVFPGA
jgi:hypothetical protein